MAVLLCVLTAALGFAAEGPKLVNPKRVFPKGDPVYKRPTQYHAWAMRLSPDGKHVLYSRPKPGQTLDPADFKSWQNVTYELVLRDLATGKDTLLPLGPVESGWQTVYTRFNVFDPTGARLLLLTRDVTPVRAKPSRADAGGRRTGASGYSARATTRVFLYDVAAGKLAPTKIEGPRAFAKFDRTGAGLVGVMADMKSRTMRLYTAGPTGQNVRLLKAQGFPQSVCPTADVLCVWAPPKGTRGRGLQSMLEALRKQREFLTKQVADHPENATNLQPQIDALDRRMKDTEARARAAEAEYRPQRLTLYDLAADKEIAELPVHEKNSALDDIETQWTPDGRYLYYHDVEPFMRDTVEGPKERLRQLSRIWDRIAGKPANVVKETRPVGPGPAPSTMVLAVRTNPEPGEERPGGFFLHDARTGKQYPLGDDTMYLIHAWGKRVLYAKKAPDGTEAVYLAEIDMGRGKTITVFSDT